MSQSLSSDITTNEVFLSLGSNMGNKKNNLTGAIKELSKLLHTNVVKISSFYITKPIGYKNQDDFLNCCLCLKTSFSPLQLLKQTQLIENNFGRIRNIRFGPRILDIDILLFNQLNISDKDLIIPHPEMFNRSFVLIPLSEIMPKNHFYFSSVRNSLTKIGFDGVTKI